ncbi:hypothetical protein AKJ66_04710 [candidate division MSBL1 archaeon SCGC-AAA259E22]|uniref:Nitroreductase domain-containing protein n=1 Tax=candidate division MSBL1 archaeon SCGC-AAA259E22 TaxID=1698265 RepID=A0A133UD35_9EURY|nr:hypothetical protein AKJ66_04710 [candidate division MSBL1 archaeon SCGC-AAA259E22]
MENSVIKVIKERRSIKEFESTPIDEEKINKILEAGRWAPSWINNQPWKFIVVKNPEIKERLSKLVPTVYNKSVSEAPVCIVVCVNPDLDPYHFKEDGAAVTQNMALAAKSLGLGSSWIGIIESEERDTEEPTIKELLDISDPWRVLSVVPIGVPKSEPKSERKDLSKLVKVID